MGRRIALLGTALLIAAVGTLLVYLYVQRADDRALADHRMVEVLVAARAVPPGTKASVAVNNRLFVLRTIPASAVVPNALSSVAEIKDQLTRSPIYPGQQIIPDQFSETATPPVPFDLPNGRTAVTFQLNDPARVAGFVQPGSHVMVFLTSEVEGIPRTRLLLPDAHVVGVGQTAHTDAEGHENGQRGGSQALLTLALTQQEAQKMIYAASEGDLYLGLLGEGGKGRPDKGADATNLFESP